MEPRHKGWKREKYLITTSYEASSTERLNHLIPRSNILSTSSHKMIMYLDSYSTKCTVRENKKKIVELMGSQGQG